REGLLRGQTANKVDHTARLHRRHAHVTRDRPGPGQRHRVALRWHREIPLYRWPALAAAALPVVLFVTLERPGQRELAELVPDHRLGHKDGHVLASVVHRDRVPEHLGDDRRAPRPGLDDVL